MDTNSQMKRWVIWGGAVVVVAVVVVLIAWFTRPASVPKGSPAFAPTGKLTAGFPKQLILDPVASISQSYGINYSTTTNQYTASFVSSSSVGDLYDEYLTYLPVNGWPVTNKIAKYSNSRGLYAENASSIVSVAIIIQGKGSQATVSYVIK